MISNPCAESQRGNALGRYEVFNFNTDNLTNDTLSVGKNWQLLKPKNAD